MSTDPRKYLIYDPNDFIVQDEPDESIRPLAGEDIPLPEFPDDAMYLNSREFQNILWRAKQFGLEGLQPAELNQIKNDLIIQNYPQLGEFVKALEGDAQAEVEQRGTLDAWVEGIKPNLAELPNHLSNMVTSIDTWLDSETEVKHQLGQPEFIPEIAVAATKGLIKFPPEMASMLVEEVKKHGPIVGAIRWGAGLIKFPFQVNTDVFNMFGAGIPPSTQIGEMPIEEIQAPTAEEVIEQYKQDPTPIILVALPILKILRNASNTKPPSGPARAQIDKVIEILEEKYNRQIEAESQKAIPDADVRLQPPKEIPIETLKPGELLTIALERPENPYTAAQLVEIYGRNPDFIRYIASEGKVGTEPILEYKKLPTTPEEILAAPGRVKVKNLENFGGMR